MIDQPINQEDKGRSDGMQFRSANRFAYPSPDDWPQQLNALSLWLLFHLILGVLLGVYLIFLGITFCMERGTYRKMALLQPQWWSRLISLILAGLSVALAARDAAFWGQAAQVSKFTPDILGGA